MQVKEIKHGSGTIRIMDDCAKKDPKEVQEIIDNVSRTIINYYKRQTA